MSIQFWCFCVLASVLSYFPLAAQQISLHSGKILRIEKQQRESHSLCCYPATDAPLQSDVIDYNISVVVENTIYVGRYQSWTGYVPWATNELIEVKADKHLLYLKMPSGEEIRLPLVGLERTWVQ